MQLPVLHVFLIPLKQKDLRVAKRLNLLAYMSDWGEGAMYKCILKMVVGSDKQLSWRQQSRATKILCSFYQQVKLFHQDLFGSCSLAVRGGPFDYNTVLHSEDLFFL